MRGTKQEPFQGRSEAGALSGEEEEEKLTVQPPRFFHGALADWLNKTSAPAEQR
jgi:hypothetical protein